MLKNLVLAIKTDKFYLKGNFMCEGVYKRSSQDRRDKVWKQNSGSVVGLVGKEGTPTKKNKRARRNRAKK
jgi:hypothetical protein